MTDLNQTTEELLDRLMRRAATIGLVSLGLGVVCFGVLLWITH